MLAFLSAWAYVRSRGGEGTATEVRVDIVEMWRRLGESGRVGGSGEEKFLRRFEYLKIS